MVTAVELAASPGKIEHLRGSLRKRLASSPLTDGASFTTALENAYLEMWKV